MSFRQKSASNPSLCQMLYYIADDFGNSYTSMDQVPISPVQNNEQIYDPDVEAPLDADQKNMHADQAIVNQPSIDKDPAANANTVSFTRGRHPYAPDLRGSSIPGIESAAGGSKTRAYQAEMLSQPEENQPANERSGYERKRPTNKPVDNDVISSPTQQLQQGSPPPQGSHSQNLLQLKRKIIKSKVLTNLLKGQLDIEREVRKQLVRYLAKASLENKMKTRALDTLIKFYYPNKLLLDDNHLPGILKRTIMKEQIKVLSGHKKMKFIHGTGSIKSNNTSVMPYIDIDIRNTCIASLIHLLNSKLMQKPLMGQISSACRHPGRVYSKPQYIERQMTNSRSSGSVNNSDFDEYEPAATQIILHY
eukprot:gene3278-3759_t